jgi:glutamate-5-semialdehyde dehydrogenase
MVVAPSADTARLADCVEASLDRKVCNTLNVCCLPRHRADLVEALITGALRAAERAGEKVRLHVVGAGTSEAVLQAMTTLDTASQEMISVVDEEADEIMAWEWEWEKQPEFTVRLVENWLDGVSLFNDWSPQFVVSVLSGDEADLDEVFRRANAPFVGNGFTRWVDGQYALKRPELGLSNWQTGRLFARGGILSGDGVYSVRYLARHENSQQRR